MKSDRDGYLGRAVRREAGPLPEPLACQLPADLRLALNHPVRRNILRALHQQRTACTVRDLIGMARLAEESGSVLSYHAQELVRCRAATVDGELPIYRSLIAGDQLVISVLEEIRPHD